MSCEQVKSKFCPLPWNHLAIRNNGDIRVCCHANVSEGRGTLLKEDQSSFHLNDSKINDSRNAPLLKEIRSSMLRGEEHPACIRCNREEASNLRSRRTYEREGWDPLINEEQARKHTKEDGTIDPKDFPINYFDLRFGNKCNLKCRMCGPSDSNLWYNDYNKMWGEDHFYDAHGKVELFQNDKGNWLPKNDDYNWIEGEDVWLKLSDQIDHIRKILVVGGEPLIVDSHYKLLEKCIELGTSKRIILEYNTNMVTIPNKAWKLWKDFKEVRIGMSIDAYSKANDYIRHPSKWEKIEENIRKINSAEGSFRVWIATTVQAYNSLAIIDLMKWKLESGLNNINNTNHKPIITTHPVHNPQYLNIKVFPQDVKDKIAKDYRDFYPWVEEWAKRNDLDEKTTAKYMKATKDILEGYIKYMNSEDLSEHLSKFFNYTMRMDQIRNERFDLVFPKLYEYLKPHMKND